MTQVEERIGDAIEAAMNTYRAQHSCDVDGAHLPLMDLLTPAGETVAAGKNEIHLLADHVFNAVIDVIRTPSPASPSPVGEYQFWNESLCEWMRCSKKIHDGIEKDGGKVRELYEHPLAAQAPKPASAGGEHWAIRAGDVMADWCNRSGAALRAMMDAYERRIRTECTPEQLAKKPWECAEYIEARRTLDEKPVWTVSIAAEADTAKDGAK